MPLSMPRFNFAHTLLLWFDDHGRKHLPWQQPIAPYRVWLSEVMLQQTQVDTVIPYFNRFVQQFPNIESLAAAKQDDVLHLWTGLGYYARARNLHLCAQTIVEKYQGEFPADAEILSTLPGIGKSTARAITSIAFGHASAILDGNVKRVLARFHAVSGWPGNTKIAKTLWQHAETHMPNYRCADYTQAIMDLGATLCTRSKPRCHQCPLSSHCRALKTSTVDQHPGKKPSKKIPIKSTVMLITIDPTDRLYLERRPPQGIWGGLWSFPEFESSEQALTYAQKIGKIVSREKWAAVKHVFSHYKLEIHPLLVHLKNTNRISSHNNAEWVTLNAAMQRGLAAPVKKLIERTQQPTTF